MSEENEVLERRRRQRFVAKRRGEYCFWVLMDGERLPLLDLSLEGFAMPASTPPPAGHSFSFVLQRAGVPDEISGRASVVNCLSGVPEGQAGCLFEALQDGGRERLEDWLVAHVLATASLPITEKDATRIVSGPSLI